MHPFQLACFRAMSPLFIHGYSLPSLFPSLSSLVFMPQVSAPASYICLYKARQGQQQQQQQQHRALMQSSHVFFIAFIHVTSRAPQQIKASAAWNHPARSLRLPQTPSLPTHPSPPSSLTQELSPPNHRPPFEPLLSYRFHPPLPESPPR
mmetsp:Transcript_35650/g.65228  ORF Transcript_35650/g.65228 Transcript_35650/m.65228 type:complete len:150 (-) Transcript_35650:452-901(-)